MATGMQRYWRQMMKPGNFLCSDLDWVEKLMSEDKKGAVSFLT